MVENNYEFEKQNKWGRVLYTRKLFMTSYNKEFLLKHIGYIDFKRIKNVLLRYENDFETFVEDRSWQINSWYENQKYFINFLNKNKLSKMYAYGSYYYLLYKIFNLRDLNLRLILSYLIFYPYNFTKKILSLIFKINQK